MNEDECSKNNNNKRSNNRKNNNINNTAFVSLPIPTLFSNHLFNDGYYYDDDACANEYFSRTLLENRQYLIHIYGECFIESDPKCNYSPDLNDFVYRCGRKIM